MLRPWPSIKQTQVEQESLSKSAHVIPSPPVTHLRNTTFTYDAQLTRRSPHQEYSVRFIHCIYKGQLCLKKLEHCRYFSTFYAVFLPPHSPHVSWVRSHQLGNLQKLLFGTLVRGLKLERFSLLLILQLTFITSWNELVALPSPHHSFTTPVISVWKNATCDTGQLY